MRCAMRHCVNSINAQIIKERNSLFMDVSFADVARGIFQFLDTHQFLLKSFHLFDFFICDYWNNSYWPGKIYLIYKIISKTDSLIIS